MKNLIMVYVEMYVGSEGRYKEDKLIAVVRNEEEAKAVMERYERRHQGRLFPWVRREGKLIFTIEEFKNEWA